MLLIFQLNFESFINDTQKQNIIFELKYPQVQNINNRGVYNILSIFSIK